MSMTRSMGRPHGENVKPAERMYQLEMSGR